MTRGEEIIIQSYDYDKYLLDTGFSTEEAALKCMRVAFIDGARWADAHPRWISVEDELPNFFDNVLYCDEHGEYYTEIDNIEPDIKITHWMHIPACPPLQNFGEKLKSILKGGEEVEKEQ